MCLFKNTWIINFFSSQALFQVWQWKLARWVADIRLYCFDILFTDTVKYPTHVQDLVAGCNVCCTSGNWCNHTGEPVQTRHQGIPPLACATLHCIATGKISGTSHSTREGRGGKRGQLYFCCSVNIHCAGPAGEDRVAWLGSVPVANL